MTPPEPARRADVREVVSTWWPLAASWLLMGLELPAVSAMMARLPDPTVSLAAYGGVVFPLALLIESPIVMLLTASTALSKDWPSYRMVRRFMFLAAGSLTLLHVLIAFTPLYDLVVGRLLAPPAEVLEPARRGLRIMLPWTISIAYRRFQQGVLIRFGRSRAVGSGTAVRLGANMLVLAVGYVLRSVPGIVVGTLAVTAGVIAEAVFAGNVVRPVLDHELPRERVTAEPLTLPWFFRFYIPLSMLPIFGFAAVPLTTAGMSRMPSAMDSLAVWPVVNGLVFTLRSTGFALNEVVVSLLERPRSLPALERFGFGLAAATTLMLVVTAASPLGRLWFGRVSALPPGLVLIASAGLWYALLLPALSALQSLYQGVIVHSHRTRAVTESMVIYLAVVGATLLAGVLHARWTALYVGLASGTLGAGAQVAWLWWRARGTMRGLADRDLAAASAI